jgi:hypothetical protein
MKVNAQNMWLGLALLAALATQGVIRADEEPASGQPEARVQSSGGVSWAQLPQAAALDRANALFSNGFGTFGSHGPNSPAATIRKAAEAVRDAKDSQEKEAAQKKLVDALNKCYDEDMAQREKELKQIEERLAKLRELLERRRAKKQDIIDLQVKVALNEADGLGFYDGDRPGKAAAGGFSFEPRVRAVERAIAVPAAAPAPRKEQPK